MMVGLRKVITGLQPFNQKVYLCLILLANCQAAEFAKNWKDVGTIESCMKLIKETIQPTVLVGRP